MSYAMLLDDERGPDHPRVQKIDREFVVCKNCFQAKKALENFGCPDYIAFDHDLGVGYKETGHDFAKLLVEMDIESGGKYIPNNFEFHVHSMNPVGARNIYCLLKGYLRSRSKGVQP